MEHDSPVHSTCPTCTCGTRRSSRTAIVVYRGLRILGHFLFGTIGVAAGLTVGPWYDLQSFLNVSLFAVIVWLVGGVLFAVIAVVTGVQDEVDELTAEKKKERRRDGHA